MMAVRLHRVLLRAYPRDFRGRFGDEMQRVFEARLAAARPAAARWGLAAHALADVAVSGLAERLRRVRQRRSGRPSLSAVWDGLRVDLRFAIRLMRHSPWVTSLSVLALALGIGANSAIFSAIDGVLLEPLPYGHPTDLVMIWSDNTHEHHPDNPVSPADYRDFRAMNHTLAGLESMTSFLAATPYQDGPTVDVAPAASISAGMFALLGRAPFIGHEFTNDDAAEVILGYGFWQRRYGGDRSVVGRRVQVSGVPSTVAGVMPPDFVFPYHTMLGPSGVIPAPTADLWITPQFVKAFSTTPTGEPVRQVRMLGLIGRLKPDATLTEARADLAGIAAQLERAYPATNQGWGVTMRPLLDQTVSGLRPALLLLLCGVGVVLLMACANVANLLLARSVSRTRELAIRSAIGASRGRLVQLAFLEGLLLSLAAAGLGLAVLGLAVRAIVALAPPDMPRLSDVHAGSVVVAFTLALAVVTGFLVSVGPAVAALRTNVSGALKDESRGTTASKGGRRARAALVVSQIALAVLLTCGVVQLGRSFVAALDVDPGFQSERLLTLQISLPPRYNTTAAQLQFYDELFARLDALPGVVSAGGTTRVPLGSTNVSTQVAVEGRSLSLAQLPEVEFRRALGAYFSAMGIPILRGRDFTPADGPTTPRVCVINHAAQLKLFQGEDPIGRRVRIGTSPTSPWLTVVGVIGDIVHSSLEEPPRPELYVSGRQGPPNSPFVVVRVAGDAAQLGASVRAAIRAIDPSVAAYGLRTMDQLRSDSLSQRRFLLTLVAILGGLALVLAAVGVFGVMSLIVTERRAEVGVRLALGASRVQVLGLMLASAAWLGVLGIVLGLGGTLVTMPLLASQLFGVSATDAAPVLSVVACLFLVTILAALVPARRAMRLDPAVTLRGD